MIFNMFGNSFQNQETMCVYLTRCITIIAIFVFFMYFDFDTYKL